MSNAATPMLLCVLLGLTALGADRGTALAADSDVTPAALLERAREARRAAEANLAEARRRRLEERKVLAAELQREYGVLATARERAGSALAELKRLKARSADVERETALADARIRRLLDGAASATGADAVGSEVREDVERMAWAALAGRLARLRAAMKVTTGTETVLGRDGHERDVPVLRLGAYAAYACGAGRDACGLLQTTAGGDLLVAGSYLDEEQCAALRRAVAGDVSRLPIDVDGALADRAPEEPTTARSWLDAGGVFIYPIILVGVLGLCIVVERVGYLVMSRTPIGVVRGVIARLGSGDLDGARELVASARTPAARVLLAATDVLGRSEQEREAAMESALLAEAPKLERALSLLSALAGVAPLLGLLGTVSGMIATFDTIAAAGTGNPRLLSGGISEALITTELGLIVAIPLLLAHAWLEHWVARREALLEYSAIQAFAIEDAEEGAVR